MSQESNDLIAASKTSSIATKRFKTNDGSIITNEKKAIDEILEAVSDDASEDAKKDASQSQ